MVYRIDESFFDDIEDVAQEDTNEEVSSGNYDYSIILINEIAINSVDVFSDYSRWKKMLQLFLKICDSFTFTYECDTRIYVYSESEFNRIFNLEDSATTKIVEYMTEHTVKQQEYDTRLPQVLKNTAKEVLSEFQNGGLHWVKVNLFADFKLTKLSEKRFQSLKKQFMHIVDFAYSVSNFLGIYSGLQQNRTPQLNLYSYELLNNLYTKTMYFNNLTNKECYDFFKIMFGWSDIQSEGRKDTRYDIIYGTMSANAKTVMPFLKKITTDKSKYDFSLYGYKNDSSGITNITLKLNTTPSKDLYKVNKIDEYFCNYFIKSSDLYKAHMFQFLKNIAIRVICPDGTLPEANKKHFDRGYEYAKSYARLQYISRQLDMKLITKYVTENKEGELCCYSDSKKDAHTIETDVIKSTKSAMSREKTYFKNNGIEIAG